MPCPAQVAAALDFLEDLGIAGPEALGPLVSTFPEALGLRVELMQENVQVGGHVVVEGGCGWWMGIVAADATHAWHCKWCHEAMPPPVPPTTTTTPIEQVLRDKWYMKVRWWHGSLVSQAGGRRGRAVA